MAKHRYNSDEYTRHHLDGFITDKFLKILPRDWRLLEPKGDVGAGVLNYAGLAGLKSVRVSLLAPGTLARHVIDLHQLGCFLAR